MSVAQHHLADDAQCPGCDAKINGATPIYADAKPKPGDLSVCCACGCLLEFIDADGHCQHLPVAIFRGLPISVRKELARVQGQVLAALKGGRL